MRTRNCILTFALLALPTLGGCRGPLEAPPPGPISTGNIQIVVTPKNLLTPKVTVSYWTDASGFFVADLIAEGNGFHIEVPAGWYHLEEKSILAVREYGSSYAVFLTDSLNENLLLQNTKYAIDGDPGINSATSTWQGLNPMTNKHEFLVAIIFKDMLFWIKLEADA